MRVGVPGLATLNGAAPVIELKVGVPPLLLNVAVTSSIQFAVNVLFPVDPACITPPGVHPSNTKPSLVGFCSVIVGLSIV